MAKSHRFGAFLQSESKPDFKKRADFCMRVARRGGGVGGNNLRFCANFFITVFFGFLRQVQRSDTAKALEIA